MHALKDIIGNSVKEGRIEEHKDWSPGDYLGPDCHRTKQSHGFNQVSGGWNKEKIELKNYYKYTIFKTQ